MRNLLTVLVAASLSSVVMLGQGTPATTAPDPTQRVAHRVNRLATLLSLTESQKTQATTIFAEEATAMSALRGQGETARTALAEAVKKNDAFAIDQAATTLGTLHGKTIAIGSKANAAFYAILTAEQKTKLDALPGHGGVGRGGPGPGPGGRGALRGRPNF